MQRLAGDGRSLHGRTESRARARGLRSCCLSARARKRTSSRRFNFPAISTPSPSLALRSRSTGPWLWTSATTLPVMSPNPWKSACRGGPVFTEGPSAFVILSASTTGTIRASNSANDMLTLLFTTPQSGAWTGFDSGQIFFGDLVFGDLTGSLLGDCRRHHPNLRPLYNRSPTPDPNRDGSRAVDLDDAARRPCGPRPGGEGPPRVGLPSWTSLRRSASRLRTGRARALGCGI